ncbi:hypothetical protein [Pseudoalteromonas piscicida]|uniref:hypothetical protein n=1 Tax=Pseudoalteromonas piscicida TaxID=43662 RepID=UPI0030A39271
MIITIMSFFSIIPLWFATVLLYLASPKQRYLATPINKPAAYVAATLLTATGFILLTLQFPLVSAALATLVVLMSSLVSVTLLSGYPIKRFYCTSAMVFVVALLLGGIANVA